MYPKIYFTSMFSCLQQNWALLSRMRIFIEKVSKSTQIVNVWSKDNENQGW